MDSVRFFLIAGVVLAFTSAAFCVRNARQILEHRKNPEQRSRFADTGIVQLILFAFLFLVSLCVITYVADFICNEGKFFLGFSDWWIKQGEILSQTCPALASRLYLVGPVFLLVLTGIGYLCSGIKYVILKRKLCPLAVVATCIDKRDVWSRRHRHSGPVLGYDRVADKVRIRWRRGRRYAFIYKYSFKVPGVEKTVVAEDLVETWEVFQMGEACTLFVNPDKPIEVCSYQMLDQARYNIVSGVILLGIAGIGLIGIFG